MILINGISDNMASLVQTGKYVAINAAGSTPMICYVVNYWYDE